MSWGQTGVSDTDSPGAADKISGHGVWGAKRTADGRLEKIEPLDPGFHRTLGQGTSVNPQQGGEVDTPRYSADERKPPTNTMDVNG